MEYLTKLSVSEKSSYTKLRELLSPFFLILSCTRFRHEQIQKKKKNWSGLLTNQKTHRKKSYLSTNSSSLSLCTIKTWVTLKDSRERQCIVKNTNNQQMIFLETINKHTHPVSLDARQARCSWESTSSL